MAELDFNTLRRDGGDEDARAVSAHELRRYAAGELADERRAEIGALLESDAALKAELDELEAEKRAFQAAMPFGRFEADHKARSQPEGLFARLTRVRWQAFGGFAAAAACAAIIAVNLGDERPPPDPVQRWAQNQTKGGDAKLGFFVRESAGVRLGTDGENLAPGAQIQFAVVDVADASAMVIVGVDGKGAVSTYATRALTGREKGPSGGGKARLLEQSLVLDDAMGPERFFVVYGSGAVGQVQRAAEDAARALVSQGSDLVRTERLSLADGYTQGSVHIVKVR
jgi:anti-sigma factor RsiW